MSDRTVAGSRAPRLGINVIRLTRTYTGVGRYLEALLRVWAAAGTPFSSVTLYASTDIRSTCRADILDAFASKRLGRVGSDPVWEYRELRKVADEVDLLFCPSYTIPLVYPGPAVVAYHGPSQNRFPQLEWWRSMAYERLYRYSARRARHVLTCSDAVGRRVTDVYGVPGDRVSTVYYGVSDAFHPVAAGAAERVRSCWPELAQPYVVFVGKLSRRHFIDRLIEAFAQAVRGSDAPHKLALVGPNYLKLNIDRMAAQAGVTGRVIHVPYVDHAYLADVYGAADFAVFPASEAEGFGLPVLEAMACGVPMLTTDAGGLSEFAPGATLMIPESSIEELTQGMTRLFADAELRQHLRVAGPRRAAAFTWENCADSTMDVLWRVATEPRP